MGPEFRENVAHRLRDHIDKFEEEGFVKAKCAAVTDCTTQDTAQNVSAAFVRWNNSVGNRKRKCPDVIGNHAESDVDLFLLVLASAFLFRNRRAVFLTAEFFELVKNRAKDIRFVIGDRAGEIGEVFRSLDDCGHALETHAGIDVPLWQKGE